MRLYSLVPFDRGAKVRWLFGEMGVAFEEKQLDRERGEHESPEFLRLNPMGRVPVLQIGDRAIFESGAICEYLADLYPEKGLAPRHGTPERGEYLQWMYFAMQMLDTLQTRIMVVEDIPAGEVRAEKEAALISDLGDAIHALDHQLGHGKEFLMGDRFSAADISVVYHLHWLTLWPELEAVIRQAPRVMTYLEKLRARPEAQRSGAFSYEA